MHIAYLSGAAAATAAVLQTTVTFSSRCLSRVRFFLLFFFLSLPIVIPAYLCEARPVLACFCARACKQIMVRMYACLACWARAQEHVGVRKSNSRESYAVNCDSNEASTMHIFIGNIEHIIEIRDRSIAFNCNSNPLWCGFNQSVWFLVFSAKI